MSATDRITSGPVDPDLEAVLPGLARMAARYRQLNSMLANPILRLQDLQPQKSERADITAAFSTTAARLKITGEDPGRSLMLLVERADDLYRARRRRPTLAQVLQSLLDNAAAVSRDAEDAAVEVRLAQGAAVAATRRLRASEGAAAYLEACRG